MGEEYIELRPAMADWLKAHAESRGVTLRELVAHILLSYQEEWEDLDEEESADEEEGDSLEDDEGQDEEA